MADYFEKAIESAQRVMADETNSHEKRMEFWTGYISAMKEAKQQHLERSDG